MPSTDKRAPAPVVELASTQRQELLYWLKLDRALETRLANMLRQGKVPGGLYRGLGQEAISVGSAYALGPGDWFAPVIRNIGTCLVRGIEPRLIMSQHMGRSLPAGGRDTGTHLGFLDKGMVSTISPLGGLVSVMAGVALGFKMRGERKVALTYSGDGQTSTGSWHEGVNFAAAQTLPFVLIVENNGWAYSTPVKRQTRLTDLADRARAYGIPGVVVDGNDVEAVHAVTRQAIERAREGGGPTMIEAKTFRRLGHSEHDDPRRYVPAEDFARWEKNDPIDRYEKRLIEEGVTTREGIASLDARIEVELDQAQAWAEAVPLPGPETLTRGIYAEG
ncbi:MAG TPA: thiamine pyrophosphate-dependent dehydrogenase E1 component subunit alpha [Candidatus Polarisedimenticolia bacterium]|jgi:TPP-dependent pyruvate/acetoin dehydrogenase alpha subunit